jgi:uncharacterized membrane-anchored protein
MDHPMLISHPLRTELHDELHTRPRPAITVPHVIAHASVIHPSQFPSYPKALLDWCASNGIEAPAPEQFHFTAAVGTTRLRWELHGEFHEYTFYDTECDAKEPFAPNHADRCLEQLLKHEEGQLIAALRLTVLAADGCEDGNALAARVFDGDELVAASVCDQRADMYSDFRLDATGCGRFLLIDRESRPPQLGRVVQRIIDMEVYRMMAMLAYPEARELARSLRVMEPRLSGLVTRLDLATTSEEPEILQDLTQLSAEVEQLSTYSAYRLDAARAYRGLVRQSLSDLRQVRLGWHQTPSEFLERRFDPVMNFCEAVNVRLESVSARVSRASGLLGTRVEIDRERQNQELLGAMNERAAAQLHLQQTVEGLSVAAIAYYATGLFAYLFKAADKAGLPVRYELATGLAVVPVVLLVWWFLRRARGRVGRADKPR